MFEWDQDKDRKNRAKHGVAFADTFAVFEDPNALTIEDTEHNEQRFVTIGVDCLGRVLVVAYTWRAERIRIISARPANRTEVSHYEIQL